MLTAVRQYWSDLIEATGAAWNQFWFTPQYAAHLLVLRQLVGLFALAWLASFSVELVNMFGEYGWLSPEVVHQTTTNGDLDQAAPGVSYLFLIRSYTLLWMTHAVALTVLSMLVLGMWPRITTPLTLVIVLSYVHRAPMVTTVFETVLCMLLLYLSIAPIGDFASFRRGTATNESTWITNLVTRLIQVHLCGFYLSIAASKLGTPAWWTADATWYLMADAQHRLVDFGSLTSNNTLLNSIGHAWLLFELLFPVLIWVRRLRPLMIAIATVVWLLTAIVTGQIGYCLLLMVANLVFVSPTWLTNCMQRE